MFQAFLKTLEIVRKDKIIIFLSIIPIIIGFIILLLFGTAFYTFFLTTLLESVKSFLGIEGIAAGFINSIIISLTTIILFIFANWSFIFLVSIIAGFFHDLISERTEKLINKNTEEFTIWDNVKNIPKIILNEIKKTLLIISLSLLGFSLSIIPYLAPISFLISSVLISFEFLGFNWGRHQFNLSQMTNNYKSNFFQYTFSGFLFIFILSVPILNLILLPIGVIYFTILFSQNYKLSKS